MFRKISLATAALCFLCRGAAFADTWTFQQILREASAGYPTVLSKVASKEAAAAEVQSAKWQRFPVPSLQTEADRGGNTNFVFRVQQVLWAGGSISNGIASARFLEEASERGVREAQFDVASRVIDAYVDAVRQETRKTISRENLHQHELLDDAIKRRVASEVSPLVDEELSSSRLSQAVNDLSVVDQNLSRSLNLLSELSGKDVTEAAPLDLAAIPLPENVQAAIDQAIERSPTLSRLYHEEQAAEAQVKVKKAVYWPSLALRYEKSVNNNANFYGLPSDSRITVVLEAQPGAGLSAFSGVASAVARKDAAQQERRSALLDLKRLIADSWRDLEAAKSQLQVAARSRVSAEKVAESYKRQYLVGRKAWLDVLNAVREATQTQLSVADADAQVAVSTLRLALLTERLNLDTKK